MTRVLITGINGLIGTLLREQLADRYEISGITRHPVDYPTHIADITDLDAMLPAFDGIDTVVHMAGASSPSTDWDGVYRNNVLGTYNVFEAARRAGVGSVVYASSNHAYGMWEVQEGAGIYDPGDPRSLSAGQPFQPDSLYGWSKAASEVLGRYFSDVYGLRVFCLRIGWVTADDDLSASDVAGETVPPLPKDEMLRRGEAIYLSHRDCVELVRCCIDSKDVRYGVYYGISNDPRRFYDISNAREEIGYIPRDTAPA